MRRRPSCAFRRPTAEMLRCVKRFVPKPSDNLPHGRAWPASEAESPSTVFSPRPPLRSLVVLVDDDMPGDTGSGEAVELLAGLLSHESVVRLRHSDDGPPPGAERRSGRFGESAPGWVLIHDAAPEIDHVPITWSPPSGDTVHRGGLSGNAADVAAEDDRTDAYTDLGPADAARRRRDDAVVAMIADAVHADLLITSRPYLHAVGWDLPRKVVVATPEQALPLVSLYLRTQGAFITYRSADGTATDLMDEGLFFWTATRDLLPAGWRWFAACVQHRGNDESLIYLAQSAFQRVQRALQARDMALRALNRPQNNNTAEAALAQLDVVMLSLMAAADVLARVAHRVLCLAGGEYSAGWQRARWTAQLDQAAPELAELVSEGTHGRHVMTLLSKLRNSIHGAALNALAVGSTTGRRDRTLVGLPHGDIDELVAAVEALGGPQHFGIDEVLPSRLHADPAVLLDAVFVDAVRLLNKLMVATPVERLQGVSLAEADFAPPTDEPFDEWTRRSIRLQVGLV